MWAAETGPTKELTTALEQEQPGVRVDGRSRAFHESTLEVFLKLIFSFCSTHCCFLLSEQLL